MTEQEVLLAAADLLEQPGAWTQCSNARNRYGNAVPSNSPEAVGWCLLGAICKVSDTLAVRDRAYAMVGLYMDKHNYIGYIGSFSTVDYNDHPDRMQAEVVAVLRGAAEEVPA